MAAACAIGSTAVQLFLRAPGRWAAGALADGEVERFHAASGRLGGPSFAHAPYLLNLASSDDTLRRRSIATLAEELRRAELLGIAGVVLHPGSAVGGRRSQGEARCRDALRRAVDVAAAPGVPVLLEVTPGAGGQLGRTPVELGRLAPGPMRRHVGLCLDTAHLWGGGFDLLKGGWGALLDEVRDEWGLDAVRLIHANDTAVECGSRRDRHAPPGDGLLGEAFFRRMLAEERLAAVPVVVEIPPGEHNELARRVVARLRRWQRPPHRRGASSPSH